MNRQQLASKIWESANKMRSKIEANEYKDYILGFIFYKFLSDKEEGALLGEGWTNEDLKELKEEDSSSVTYCQNKFGYFISYENLFSTWLSKGRDFDVSNVRDALKAFSRLINKSHRKVFTEIFDTLDSGLSKLGDSSGAQTKAISDLIHLIDGIPMDGKQGYDVLGFIYEYLIGMFAANAGKKAGEFYTPHEVSVLMSEIVAYHLRDRSNINIYDPTSGSGSLLINIGKALSRHMNEKNKIKYYAQELKKNTYNLTRMNLVMRGILPDNIVTRNADTLAEDWPYFDEEDPNRTYAPLYVDAVVSNPPYSQQWDPSEKDGDPRYDPYGYAPKSKADYAFLLHDLYHVKPDGIMTIVLPHGVLFRGGEEEKIRKNLIENNKIDAIIGLPSNIFFGTGIPTIIMVLKQNRSCDDILIIDASKGFIKVGKNNKLQASDIKKIVDTFIKRGNKDFKFARVIKREEIRKNDYNLNIPRYVNSSEKSESWDLYATMFGGIPNHEIDELGAYWEVFPHLKKSLFKNEGTPYSELISKDINKVLHNSQDIHDFKDHFCTAFSDFPTFLVRELIDGMDRVERSKEEQIISDELFQGAGSIPLVDKYRAYQILDDSWRQIENDLEIIQTEGKDSIRVVDPHKVIKKKGEKEDEVQDCWIGRILPFDLVQKCLFEKELGILKTKEQRLSEIVEGYSEIIDSLSEEEKDGDYLNDDKTSFQSAEVKKFVKSLPKKERFSEDSIEYKILHVSRMLDEEKIIKKDIKDETSALESQTKNAIETLSIEQCMDLLKHKWISPLVEALEELPDMIIKEFETKIMNLANKYSLTALDIESQLKDTSISLSEMIDDLNGDEYDLQSLYEFKSLLNGD